MTKSNWLNLLVFRAILSLLDYIDSKLSLDMFSDLFYKNVGVKFKFLLLLYFFSFSYSSNAESLNETGAAPDFKLPLLIGEGSSALKEFRGKVVLLDFWASWCPPCLKSFTKYQELYELKQQQGLEIVAISVDINKKDAISFLKGQGVTFHVLYDFNSHVAEQYQLPGMPTSFLIDRQGRLLSAHIGFNKKVFQQIKNEIDQALLGEEV